MTSMFEKMMSVKTNAVANVLTESFTDKDCIPTDVPILNIAFSGKIDGGLVPGITVFAGESKSFKSLLSIYCMKAYLQKYPESVAVFYDSEWGTTLDYWRSLGVDTDRVIHIQIENIEQLKFDIVKRLQAIEKGDKIFFMIDSLGALASAKEIEDAINEKSVADMTRAKAIRSLLRMITPHFSMKDIPCVIINHVYKTMELYSKNVVGGGCLVDGTEIVMDDGSLKAVELIQIGDYVRTLDGTSEVTEIWNPETLFEGTPECYEIEFEDGTTIICSDNHSFVIGDEWVQASKLKPNDSVETISSINNSGIHPKPETYYAHSLQTNLFGKKKK